MMAYAFYMLVNTIHNLAYLLSKCDRFSDEL